MAPANRNHAFDLHVLSMPPAFVLSQDQTLMFNPDKSAILSDSRPVVQGPVPAQRPDPIGPPNAQAGHNLQPKASPPAKTVPRRATGSP
jgi:hypothetical protein